MPSVPLGRAPHGRCRALGAWEARRSFCVARAEPGQQQQAPQQQQFRIRQARLSDTDAVAALCAEVFGPTTFAGIAAWLVPSDTQVQRAAQDLRRDVDVQLSRSLRAKQEARRQAREVRLLQLNALMRAELDRLAGRPAVGSPFSSPLQRQAQRRWRRARQFACLVAEPLAGGAPPHAASGPGQERPGSPGQELAGGPGQPPGSSAPLAGCAVVSLAAPEALLPPPWPSRAPLCCCVSNVAVGPAFRRRRAASQLLAACERLARRWGAEDLWLHTEARNAGARALYRAAGYAEAGRDPALFGPFRRVLLRKPLPPALACGRGGGGRQPEARLGSGKRSGGTYVWRVTREGQDQ